MEKKLETYLQTVESELSEMREARREGEMREMRQHLEAIVTRLTEGGLSQEEATEAAIVQFGEARQVGRELEKAGTRKEALLRTIAAPLGGALCFVVLVFVANAVTDTITKLAGTGLVNWEHSPIGIFLTFGSVALASGAVSGFISPRWGGRLLLGSASLLLTWVGVAGCADLLFFSLLLGLCSGVLLGARWAGRLSQRKAQRQAVGAILGGAHG